MIVSYKSIMMWRGPSCLLLVCYVAILVIQVSDGHHMSSSYNHDNDNRQRTLSSAGNEISSVDQQQHESHQGISGEISRKRRNIVSMLMTGISMLMTVTEAGINIADAVQGGCSHYSTICTNGKIISSLEEEIKILETTFKDDVFQFRKLLLYAIESNSNNKYILYYVNKLMDSVTRIEDIYKGNLANLNAQFSDAAPDQEQQNLRMDTLAYSLLVLERIIEENKHSQMLGFALQLLFEITLHEMNESSGELLSAEDYRSMLHLSLDGTKAKLNDISAAIYSASDKVEEAISSRTNAFRESQSKIGDGFQMDIFEKRWKIVDQKMNIAKGAYELYKTKLEKAIETVHAAELEVVALIGESVDMFENIVTKFTNIVYKVIDQRNEDPEDRYLPVNYNAVIFTTDFNQVDQANLLDKQKPIIAFLKKTTDDYTNLVHHLHAMHVLYEVVQEDVNRSECIAEIFATLKSIYSHDSSPHVVAYGAALAEPAVVCIVSMLNQHMDIYDYYDLTAWKPLCDITDEQFKTMKQQVIEAKSSAIVKRTLNNVVPTQDFDDESLAGLLDLVKYRYDISCDDALVELGSTLTGRDIICAIAEEFPDRLMYAFYDLVDLRATCETLTQTEFEAMSRQVSETEKTYVYVKGDLNYCIRRGMGSRYCLCLDELADDFEISEDQVKHWMKKARPDLEQYCGNPRWCDCEDL